MNGTGIRVTPEQLRQVAGRLTGAAGEIDGTLRQLATGVEPLGTDWAGVAQARFLELWDDWQRSAAGLHHALTGISACSRPRTFCSSPSSSLAPQRRRGDCQIVRAATGVRNLCGQGSRTCL